jgi:hypothetical protein
MRVQRSHQIESGQADVLDSCRNTSDGGDHSGLHRTLA